MDTKTKRAQSIIGTSTGRNKEDFYPTPAWVTESLLNLETFSNPILEPACGNGAMSKVLIKRGYDVQSSDLYDWGYGTVGQDFFNINRWDGCLVTNPPFNVVNKFIEHAIFDLECKKVALFCKLALLETVKRSYILEKSPLKNIWVFRNRVLLTRNGEEPRGSGMIAFAWFVWENGYKEKPTVGWI